ncbi:DUF3592 domain-containing protein [Microbulbifer thermotolerans]|uniref:DUF3592 domain-containing protein n=1 Tax=Microbulbifer thermotolerans TaxID=252514 RepID=UPI0008E74A60|nr:DUF3592 domain-containing protein [Microbulbifer thermotolerans]MCX2796253.1 DUF3592 domain-containing protein [Microbulbifer thermotolerans]MCX2833109.1 DUF3592 domain-containing protein [Microbulbifer thermotolerans]MCX2842114.1 DUF3592 domain-containing protein [Microbulbifer thermotolerans]WKT60303.1 DUF3592 domain-containing protein [Microbulbifer thermotolerans]SFC05528.1 Protein of unknown function [Microbulbifer thermotolerans]
MFGILKYVGFLILAFIGVGQTYIYRRIQGKWRSFPVVRGKIIESKLENFTNIEGQRVYEASIKFEYEFEGQRYCSDTPLLRSPQLFKDHNLEHELLKKYKVGDHVDVKVLPRTPEVAFIEVEPFSRLSAIAIPILILLYIASIFGYGWFIAEVMGHDSNFGDWTFE